MNVTTNGQLCGHVCMCVSGDGCACVLARRERSGFIRSAEIADHIHTIPDHPTKTIGKKKLRVLSRYQESKAGNSIYTSTTSPY